MTRSGLIATNLGLASLNEILEMSISGETGLRSVFKVSVNCNNPACTLPC